MGRTVRNLAGKFGNHCNEITNAWNKFWFSPRDPFALCVIRCLVGWMAFYTTFVWGLELEAFFHPHSYNSAALIKDHFLNVEGPYAFSFWTWVPVEWMWQVHYASLAITFCFMIGLFTRVSSVLTLAILISYAYRARFATYGLDQINIILTLYLCLTNCAAYLSVDRLFKRYRLAKKALFAGKNFQKLPEPNRATVSANLATRLIQFHFCVIYLSAGMGKLYGETWWDGSAMWRGLANAEYQTFDMTWLAYFPYVTQFLTHLTIAWELSFCFLVWRPLTRPWVLLIGLGMHFGIGMMLGMWTFGTCMMFGYLAYYQPENVKAVFRAVRDTFFKSKRKLLHVNPSASSIRKAARKKTFDLPNRLALAFEGTEPNENLNESGSKQNFLLPGIAHLVLLNPKENLHQNLTSIMAQNDLTLTCVRSLNELQESLENNSNCAVINNIEAFTELETRDYLESILPFSMKFYPSVTLIQNKQTRQLAGTKLENYQRVLVQPCEQRDLLAELQLAIQIFEQQFPEGELQAKFLSTQQSTHSTKSDEPIDSIFG